MVPNFTAVGATFYTTARVIAARCFSAVGVGVRLPILLLLVTRLTLRLGKVLPVFLRSWRRRYAAHFDCCWCRLLHYGEGK